MGRAEPRLLSELSQRLVWEREEKTLFFVHDEAARWWRAHSLATPRIDWARSGGPSHGMEAPAVEIAIRRRKVVATALFFGHWREGERTRGREDERTKWDWNSSRRRWRRGDTVQTIQCGTILSRVHGPARNQIRARKLHCNAWINIKHACALHKPPRRINNR